jgi:Bladder cancer-related protein BC10
VSSWLPLLFIPTNASPLFILSFVTLTYILHRPCIYCSALLLILFISSCHWSDHCFFDFRGDWFSPRFTSSRIASGNSSSITAGDPGFNNESLAGYIMETMNSTTAALAGAVFEETKRRFLNNGSAEIKQEEWTGIGLEWLRSLLGRREWTLPCIDVKVRL